MASTIGIDCDSNSEMNGTSSEKEPLIAKHLRNYRFTSNLVFNQKVKAMMAAGQQVYHFGFGESPFPVMDHAVKALQESAHEGSYLPTQGLPELRQAICDFHLRFDDLRLNADNVVVGPGSKMLIYSLMNVFNGDLLLKSPSWLVNHAQAQYNRMKVFTVPTTQEEEWRVTPAIIEKLLKDNDVHPNRLLILCNPDNPTGTTYTVTELKHLTECFRKNNILVLSDEIYGCLNYKCHHESLVKFYPEGTILGSSLSKWAGCGGWRLGWYIFPNELSILKEAVINSGEQTYTCVSSPIAFATMKFLRNLPECENYFIHTRRILAAIADYVDRELSSVGVKVVSPGGGFYALPDFEILRESLKRRAIVTGEAMCQVILDECSVALMAAGPAFLRPPSELTTRLCFVNFNGAKALQASKNIGLLTPIDDDFIKERCSPTYIGIQVLKNWVLKQLS